MNELTQEIKSAHLTERVKMISYTLDMPTLYALAAVVVCPSTEAEGFGRVMAEAGAMSSPVIATHHGAAHEIILPEKTGWLVPVRDAGRLQSCLEHALRLSDEAREEMGQRARAYVAQQFSHQKFCEKTLEIYEEAYEKFFEAPLPVQAVI
jgi:glycosyltransferase involved in cell wall biosynthesis